MDIECHANMANPFNLSIDSCSHEKKIGIELVLPHSQSTLLHY